MATRQKREQFLSLIPRLKPGTYSALKVLRHAQKLIKEEPRRLDMRDWMLAYAGSKLAGTLSIPMDDRRELPACGTVGCLAGWVNIATGHHRSNSRRTAGLQSLINLGLGRRGRGYFGTLQVKYDDDALAILGEALNDLYGRTSLDAGSVVAAIDDIIRAHRKALSKAKAVVR
jgi:hypothetical protein